MLKNFITAICDIVTSRPESKILAAALLFISQVTIADVPKLNVSVIATKLTLTWSHLEGASNYRLYYAPSPYTGPETVAHLDMGTTTEISSLLPETSSFFVAVTAFVAGNESEFSNIEEFDISLKSNKGKSCEDLNEEPTDLDFDGICDFLDPDPTTPAVKDTIQNAANDFGNRILLSKERNRLINAAIFQNYSVEKHEGFIYESSSGGEPVVFPGNWYNDNQYLCSAGNFNGDQFEDIVISSMNQFDMQNLANPMDGINQERLPRTHIFLNDGQGSYVSGAHLFEGKSHHRMRSYGSPQVFDINNDGIDDILSQNGGGGDGYDKATDHGIGLYLSNRDGSYTDSTDRIKLEKNTVAREDFSEEVLQILTESFVAIDVDNDGWKDLVFLAAYRPSESQQVPFILFSDKAERFVPYEQWNPNIPKSNYDPSRSPIVRRVQVADFDNDGDQDLIALCYRECLYDSYIGQNGFVLLNERGVFNLENRIKFPDGLRGTNTKNDQMAVGDINGDGLIDIVTVSGASDPYYVDRDIQILINDGGQALIDDTENRIENLNTPDTGHAEGAIFLVDYDLDGDLDIVDWQSNVRAGKAYGTATDGSDYTYGTNGLAIFLNDGLGSFEYISENLMENADLLESDGRPLEGWLNKEINQVYGVCPAFFNRQYGYGFIYSHGYDIQDPLECPDGDCGRVTYSSVRRN